MTEAHRILRDLPDDLLSVILPSITEADEEKIKIAALFKVALAKVIDGLTTECSGNPQLWFASEAHRETAIGRVSKGLRHPWNDEPAGPGPEAAASVQGDPIAPCKQPTSASAVEGPWPVRPHEIFTGRCERVRLLRFHYHPSNSVDFIYSAADPLVAARVLHRPAPHQSEVFFWLASRRFVNRSFKTSEVATIQQAFRDANVSSADPELDFCRIFCNIADPCQLAGIAALDRRPSSILVNGQDLERGPMKKASSAWRRFSGDDEPPRQTERSVETRKANSLLVRLIPAQLLDPWPPPTEVREGAKGPLRIAWGIEEEQARERKRVLLQHLEEYALAASGRSWLLHRTWGWRIAARLHAHGNPA